MRRNLHMMRLIAVVATAAVLAIVTYSRSRGDNRGGGGNGSGGQEQSVQRDPFANRLEKLHQMMNSSDLSSPREENGSGDTLIKVLLYAKKRTGSTFVGDMLSQLPNSTFVFEPIGSRRGTTKDREWQWKTLTRIFRCDREALNSTQWAAGWGFDPGKVDCNPEEGGSAGPLVVKTVRAHLMSVLGVSSSVARLKVLHLVRDPRARLLSMQVAFSVVDMDKFVGNVIKDCRTDLTDSDALKKQLGPDRYHLARYEDFARWPLEEFEKAYKFMGLPLTQDVEDIITQRTNCNLTEMFALYKRIGGVERKQCVNDSSEGNETFSSNSSANYASEEYFDLETDDLASEDGNEQDDEEDDIDEEEEAELNNIDALVQIDPAEEDNDYEEEEEEVFESDEEEDESAREEWQESDEEAEEPADEYVEREIPPDHLVRPLTDDDEGVTYALSSSEEEDQESDTLRRRRFGVLPKVSFRGFVHFTTCRSRAGRSALRWKRKLDYGHRRQIESDPFCSELIRRMGYEEPVRTQEDERRDKQNTYDPRKHS